jgi:hypothetical protein
VTQLTITFTRRRILALGTSGPGVTMYDVSVTVTDTKPQLVVATHSTLGGSMFAVRWGHSRRARRLANQLLLPLNPKREAAAPIQCPPKAPAAPRLRFCAFGGEEPPQQGETLWPRLL